MSSPVFIIVVNHFMEKWENIKKLTQKLAKTETDDRMYYHIKIFERDGKYILGLPELSNGMEIPAGLFE